jgi:hypothetical protein
MQDGDILTAREATYIEALEAEHDMIDDMLSGKRLTEADIPDDFKALVKAAKAVATAHNRIYNADGELIERP